MARMWYVGPATTEAEALDRLNSHKGFIACDTETVSLTDRRVIGIGMAIGPTEAFYWPAFTDDEDSCHYISPVAGWCYYTLMDRRTKVWFNAPFDLGTMEKRIPSIDKMNWQDVSIMCRVQALPNSLEENAGLLFGIDHQTIQQILPKGQTMLDLDFAKVADKCVHDCMVTWMLYDAMSGDDWLTGTDPFIWSTEVSRTFGKSYDVTGDMKKAYRLDRELIPILRLMQKSGMRLDQSVLEGHYRRLAGEKQRYESYCRQRFGFNPGSNQQVGLVLSDRGNILPWTRSGGYKQYKVDNDTLTELTDPLAHWILQYRTRADQLSDVVEPLMGKPAGDKRTPWRDWVRPERTYTEFRIDLSTSRLASSNRNWQNVTPALRDVLAADDEVSSEFYWWDANQIEYRIFGEISGEENINRAYREGLNNHIITMQAVWAGSRRYLCCAKDKCTCGEQKENPLYTEGKTGNYTVMYDASAPTLRLVFKGRTLEFCQEFIDGWHRLNPTASAWQQWAGDDALEHGYVTTLEGRRCRIPDPMQYVTEGDPYELKKGIAHARTCGINYRVQGTAAWPVKEAVIRYHKAGFDQRLQVHDEVLNDGWFEVPEQERFLEFAGMKVPIEIKHGRKWQ